jgi:hypothetical protein
LNIILRKTDVFPVKKVPKVFEIDKLYAIAFTNRWYSGRCIQIVDENTAVVDFMTPSGNYFKWPPKNDVQTVKRLIKGDVTKVQCTFRRGELFSCVHKQRDKRSVYR